MHELVLARHGQSETSASRVVNGDPLRPSPLSRDGIRQAVALGDALSSTPVDLCVTSSFERTIRTAEIALTGRDVPFEIWPELDDIRFGELEGIALEDYRSWVRRHGPGATPPGGESRADTIDRFCDGLERALEREEKTVLMVVHGVMVVYVEAGAKGETPPVVLDQSSFATMTRFARAEVEAAMAYLRDWSSRVRAS